MDDSKADFFLFGATSEIAQRLFTDERVWLDAHIRRLILVQRKPTALPVYQGFDHVVVHGDPSDAREFRAQLDALVQTYGSTTRLQHVLPTYGAFNFRSVPKPHFTRTDDGLQLNLNCRLQIIAAFAAFHANTRFHLFGSLLGSFPYLGDYPLSMWFVNQLPRHPEYAALDLRVYNLGGMKTRFWDHAVYPQFSPFIHPQIPTAWLRERMAGPRRGVFDNFPTVIARVACTLGRLGLRVM